MAAEDSETILKGKYPSKMHAHRVVKELQKTDPDIKGVIYLEGNRTKLSEDSDLQEPFRQRRHFYYLTGCDLSDCHFAYDIQSSKSILFIPPADLDEVVWSGFPTSVDEASRLYDVDEVRLTTQIDPTLRHLAEAYSNCTVFTVANQVSEPGRLFRGFRIVKSTVLKAAIDKCRIIKDGFEVALLRKANHISSSAHQAVAEKAKTATNEQELEAAFVERCVANGAKKMAYPLILASGRAAATLHYQANDAYLRGKLNVLVDAGAECNNYAADITRTIPLTVTFSKRSQEIYDIVHKMQTDCIAMIQEGVNWDNVHLLAHKLAIDGLLNLGILRGDEHDILKANTSLAFFPHGLGHYIGLETHDVGGHSEPNLQDQNGLFRNLRKRGTLPAGSVITVEPGIYFCEEIIRPYLEDTRHNVFINAQVLEQYWDVGGVRIEDSVLVTSTGCENLTPASKEPRSG